MVSQQPPMQSAYISSPCEYEVFQRRTRNDGRMLVSGRAVKTCDSVTVTIAGESVSGAIAITQNISTNKTGDFQGDIEVPAGGWYRVSIVCGSDRTAIGHVGVGEVFVGAGQSNSTNCGQFRIRQSSGMVSSFSGSDWRIADDPQPGTHDNWDGGSFWPAFGDAMFEKYRVPIGVAVTGHGGTSVNQWQPCGELFDWMMTRIHQLRRGGFRAMLWHQGESDAEMPRDEYVRKMTALINTSKSEAGWEFPWFVARASYHTPANPSWPNVREAQATLWANGTALEGPDTDTLVGDNRDFNGAGIHFSPKGLTAHGKMWAEKVSVYLDSVLSAEK